jgi:hypothetical protein
MKVGCADSEAEVGSEAGVNQNVVVPRFEIPGCEEAALAEEGKDFS